MSIGKSTFVMQGLSNADANARLIEEGLNELPHKNRYNFIFILLNIIREPMFILLISAGIIYSFLGSLDEALMLLGFVFVVITITLFQENRTEKALDALKELSSPRTTVIREGKEHIIPSNQIVRGDIVKVVEGDYVPADGIVLLENNLLIDESLLTGESMPVRKVTGSEETNIVIPGGNDLSSVYSGTLVVGGNAFIFVKKTGLFTEIGKIGRDLKEVKETKSNLQLEVNQLIFKFGLGASILCTIVIILYGLIKGSLLQGFLTGITLAMAILPEEFPVVLTIFLALGAWRMSEKNVLTRRQYAIQSLGSITVLCTDKTGTITKNQMTLKAIHNIKSLLILDDESHKNFILYPKYHNIIKYGVLSSPENPYDPMERAIIEFNKKSDVLTENELKQYIHVKEYPLKKELLAVIHVWKKKNEQTYIIGTKGAPEAIWDLCHFSDNEIHQQLQILKLLTKKGLRVLAVGKIDHFTGNLSDDPRDYSFSYVGLIGFEDPIRSQVPRAVQECYNAGIRVVMITGDYPETALSIATQIGLRHNDKILVGSQLIKMSEDELNKNVKNTTVFARVLPEQKLHIVKALQNTGEITAMTGDGINDAPALKLANVGVAMGSRGTDVAREASSIILMDDDFSTLVLGIRMGRKIFDNIRKAMSYILAVHIPIAGLTIMTILFDLPLILFPIHILFLELIIDPASSVVFENQSEEGDIMKRSPRPPEEKIFNKEAVILSSIQGISALLIIFLLFLGLLNSGHTENQARALTFAALIISNIIILVINVSWKKSFLTNLFTKNKPMYYLILITFIFLTVIFSVSAIANTFKFALFNLEDFIILCCIMLLLIFLLEISKKLLFRITAAL